MRKKTVGIIGCGVIGTFLAKETERKLSKQVSELNLFDVDKARSGALAGELSRAKIMESLTDLVERSDMVVEAASGSIVRDVFETVIQHKKDVMILSVGGILGNEKVLERARAEGIRVILPSGAIAGIDGLKSFKPAGIRSVTLTTRKAPRSLEGAPYLIEKGIDVSALREETLIFESSAAEAVKAFPKNVNVSALLSIAGIGSKKTKVKIIVAPEYTKNVHEIEIEGAAGKLTIRAENVPSPENPKTSYLAALAAFAALEGYFDTVRIGT